MLIRIILSLILLSRIYVVVYGITVNFYTFSYEDKCEYLEEITNDFNDYSKKNGLDIHLNRILLSPRNISVYVNDYDSTVESILKKKNKSYDLFMISAVYTNFFDPYVENLRYYVSEETLESYLHGISSSLGIINDKIIGLPLYLEVGVFYSNKVLLEKYNKTIPQTWNQLIDTASYILEEEKKIGNNDLIGYLGYFPESEGIIGSFIEFLNSFRASYDMGLPSFNSQNAIDALIKIKEIKDSISSDANFRCSEGTLTETLSKGNTIFGRYWNLPLNDLYHITKLPGAKDDISSSFFNGYYLIMNKNIDEEHKKATGKVIDFILSKKTQLKYLNKFMKYSGMSELYNSEECNELYCNVFKSLQFVKNEKDIIKRYNECNNQIKNYINEYIYGNSNTAEDTLKHIDYIYTIYDIAYDSSVGKTITALMIIAIYIILISSFLLCVRKYNIFLKIFNKDYWIVAISGLMLSICYGFFALGKVTLFKCQTKTVVALFCTSLFYFPLLLKLIINFPNENKFSRFIKTYSTRALLGVLCIDAMTMSGIYFYPPYEVVEEYIEDGMNYNVCKLKDDHVTMYIYSLIGVRLLIFLSVAFLTFVEWNTERIYRDIRTISVILYVTLLLAILLLIINIIKVKDIYFNIIFKVMISILYALADFFVIFWLYLYQSMTDIKALSQEIIIKKSIFKEPSIKRVSRSRSKRKTFKDKILELHYSSNNIVRYDIDNTNTTTVNNNNNNNNNKLGTEIVLYTNLISSDQVTDISVDSESK